MTKNQLKVIELCNSDYKPSSCATCKIRLGYARAFDFHFWKDDCPYECDAPEREAKE